METNAHRLQQTERGGAWPQGWRRPWALAVSVFVACATTGKTSPDGGTVDRSHAYTAYRIGPEDVLEIVVWGNDAVTRTVPVRPDGMITLPLLNDVQASGLTPEELRIQLIKDLTPFLRTVDLSVIVKEIHSQKIVVLGEVLRPGRYELRGPARLLDVLAMAGGFGEFASRSDIVVHRPRFVVVDGAKNATGVPPKGVQRVVIDELQFDEDDLLSHDERRNARILPGDTIVVD